MADAAVSFLIRLIASNIIQEVSPREAQHEVDELRQELESMRSFLRDADIRKHSDVSLKNWVAQVRDAVCDAEDVIDDLFYHVDRPLIGGTMRFFQLIINRHRNSHYMILFSKKLRGVKSQITAMSRRKYLFDLIRTDEGTRSNAVYEKWRHRREASLYLDDDEIVGLDEGTEQLLSWLMDNEPQRREISVVGMGGLGKTALVDKVYGHRVVKNHFECSLWVTVSHIYHIDELLQSMVKDLYQAQQIQVPSTLENMNYRELVVLLNDYLANRRYIVVLDDVWRTDAWTELNAAFPRNKNGSRIILTTRNEDVAASLGEGSIKYQLHPLEEKDAQKLFCRKAFRGGTYPPGLEPLARNLAQKCEGLPLAIVAMGSLLYSMKEKTATERNKVCENLSWHLRNNQKLEPIKRILLLSFYDLPYYLKYCYFYCCMFPDDCLIYRKQLIRLWVAEGFVEERGGYIMEETAEGYLQELICSNLLQVAIRNECGRVKACRVHPIMRDVALSLAEEEKFCFIFDGQQPVRDTRVRRMSVYNSGDKLKSNMANLQLRSVLVFDRGMSFLSLHAVASNFKLLRILSLEGLPIETIPDAVTFLFNLRYLNLAKTKITWLPTSIAKLHNLQTLDIRHTMMKRLPRGIAKLRKLQNLFNYRIKDEYLRNFDYSIGAKKLEKLRHLFPYRVNEEYAAQSDYFFGILVPSTICSVTSLQSLSDIELNDEEIVSQIGNLTELRSFGISKVRAARAAELCHSIGKLKHLRSLCVKAITEEEPLQLENLCSPLLQKLNLNAHLDKVPQSFKQLDNLTHLWLHWSCMRADDPLSPLYSLQNLVFLELWGAYEGPKLVFPDRCFPKLKKLHLWDLKRLNQVVIEKGAMQCIQQLDLARCGELRMLPQGIQHLTELQELFLAEMPKELVERLRRKDESDEYFQNERRIPFIKHEFWTEKDGWVAERLN